MLDWKKRENRSILYRGLINMENESLKKELFDTLTELNKLAKKCEEIAEKLNMKFHLSWTLTTQVTKKEVPDQ